MPIAINGASSSMPYGITCYGALARAQHARRLCMGRSVVVSGREAGTALDVARTLLLLRARQNRRGSILNRKCVLRFTPRATTPMNMDAGCHRGHIAVL